jgi:hypothetical protein
MEKIGISAADAGALALQFTQQMQLNENVPIKKRTLKVSKF